MWLALLIAFVVLAVLAHVLPDPPDDGLEPAGHCSVCAASPGEPCRSLRDGEPRGFTHDLRGRDVELFGGAS